jgi:hypothetical protein
MDPWRHLTDQRVDISKDICAFPQQSLADQNIAKRIQSGGPYLGIVPRDGEYSIDALPRLVPLTHHLKRMRKVDAAPELGAGVARPRRAFDGRIGVFNCTPRISTERVYD